MATKDYYRILGVDRNASTEEIRKAYRRLAKQYHPDRNRGSKEAEQRFKEITEAHAVLSDEQKRRQYDLMGDASSRFGEGGVFWDNIMSGMGRPHARAGPFTYEDLGDLGDLYSQLFGAESPFTAGGPQTYEQEAAGEDIVTHVQVPFDLSVRGGHIKVIVPVEETCSACGGRGTAPGASRPCPTCRGSGMVQRAMGGFAFRRPCPQCLGRGQSVAAPCPECGGRGRTPRRRRFKVTIPAGVREGQRIRLAGEGNAGRTGGAKGDLLVEVSIAPHAEFRREGNDVYSEVAINVVQAALGTRIPVQTAQGPVSLKVPAGTNSGAKLRLRGKGVISADGTTGDHYVIVKVVTPQHLSEEQKRLLEQFAESAKLER
jgi:molecular chaperone DnaJ